MKKTIFAALLAATAISSTAGAVTLRDVFIGANGGTREITSFTTVGDVTTFTVETTRPDGVVKTREFTATRNGDQFDISGNGKQLFKDFLSEHAAVIQGVNVEIQSEETDLNKLAFEAWRTHKIENAGIFAASFERMTYKKYVDFVEIADELGLEFRPVTMAAGPVDLTDAYFNVDTSELGNYRTWSPSGFSNTVLRDDDTTCKVTFEDFLCDATYDEGKKFLLNHDDITSIVRNDDDSVTITSTALGESQFFTSRWNPSGNWYYTSTDGVEVTTTVSNLDYRGNLIIDALSAHADGITGAGVKIGVIDASDDAPVGESYVLHGDHTDNIIKAFAPDAETTRIHETAAYDGDARVHTNYWRSFADELNQQDIVNFSHGSQNYGWGTAEYYANLLPDLKEDLLVVVAAGNYGDSATTIGGANGQAVSLSMKYDDQVIVVGALNEAGTDLMGYSNRAGILKDSYIATSALPFRSHYNQQGTSFSAPVVAGAAALVKQKFGTSAVETRDILFSTADDLGAPGVDAVYGHGALNLGRALTPVGGLN